jgi:RNA polymerase sigma-70 factor (ECF subfamily)
MPGEESAWLARARRGDRTAFEALCARHEAPLYGFLAHMTGDADAAAALTRDTFLAAHRALDRTDDATDVALWLHRLAADTCRAWQRRSRLRRLLPGGAQGAAVPGDAPGPAAQRALLAMSPCARRALLLREYAGLAPAEIAEVLGLSRAAARALLHQGREEFRRQEARLAGRR